ncbi:MAG: LPS export ABC transporter ATP-binding protein [Candidatus Xenobia bacterium]
MQTDSEAVSELDPEKGIRRIHLHDLVKVYSRRKVVNGVSLDVGKGEVVGLLGSNGAGKTTTFYMVVGLVQPDGGSIFIGDRDVTRMPFHERARLGVGYLPQETSIFRRLTVEENLRLIWELRGYTKAEQEARLQVLLEEFGVAQLRSQPAYTLSGGERRRVEIARAIATDPDFLLLDEPFTGVDPIAVSELQSIIARLKQKGIGILITDHNVRETLQITDRTYIIREGRILESGTAQQIANSPIARKYYLGEHFFISDSDLEPK